MGLTRLIQPVLILSMGLSLVACGAHVYHKVRSGETLYSISWSYGVDYRQVASWNDIQTPYLINKGQRLRIAPPLSPSSPASSTTASAAAVDIEAGAATGSAGTRIDSVAAQTPSMASTPADRTAAAPRDISPPHQEIQWAWPTQGQLIKGNHQGPWAKNGVNIGGRLGQEIIAAAAGRVVYSGGGLPRYGKLIIIKHDEDYLSAYAHNLNLHVQEGDQVKPGQHIADMGRSRTDEVMLHFEIRRRGKPVNALQYLRGKSLAR